MSNSIYEEAILDAKALKEAAEERAKQKLVEAMTPKIKLLVENSFSSEDEHTNDEAENVDEAETVEDSLENENQLSWGFADNERITRMQILEMKIGRIKGYCYHMSHSRDLNGGFENPYIKQNEAEFNKVRSMNKEQLESYIKTWEWLN